MLGIFVDADEERAIVTLALAAKMYRSFGEVCIAWSREKGHDSVVLNGMKRSMTVSLLNDMRRPMTHKHNT